MHFSEKSEPFRWVPFFPFVHNDTLISVRVSFRTFYSPQLGCLWNKLLVCKKRDKNQYIECLSMTNSCCAGLLNRKPGLCYPIKGI